MTQSPPPEPKPTPPQQPPTPQSSGRPRRPLTLAAVVMVCLTLVVLAVVALRDGGGDASNESDAKTNRPPVILITIDTLRADRVGAYGGKVKTPVLDALAREGIVFEKCFTPNPLTLPAHSSLLTGTLPLFHRVRDNTYTRLPEEGLVTLAEAMKAGGYQSSAGFISSEVLAADSGIARGFDFWDDKLEGRRSSPTSTLLLRERSADETLELAGAWIEGQQNKPWLTFIHLFDPHFPFWPKDAAERGLTPPSDFEPQTLIPLYDAEVEYTDTQLGKFFERLKQRGIYDKALIIITADHGEGLGEGGELTHGSFIFDGTTHVPLLVKLPAAKHAGTRVKANVSLVDLMPTIAELSGVELKGAAAAQQQGRSLLAAFSNPSALPSRDIYIESHYGYLNSGWGRLRALRGDEHLLVFSGGGAEAYLQGRGTNVLENSPDVALKQASARAREELQSMLTTYFPANIEKVLREREAESINDQYASTYIEREDAYAENYAQPYSGESLSDVSVVRETLSDDEGRPSPHARAGELAAIQRSQLYFSEGRFQLCLNECDDILATTPESLQAAKLGALAAWRLVISLGTTSPKRSREYLEKSNAYLDQARKVALGLGMKASAADMELTLYWQRAMLGEDLARLRDELAPRVEQAQSGESPLAPASVRRLLRTFYACAYQVASSDESRGELGAMWQADLSRLGLVAEKESIDRLLLDSMLAAKPIYLAPWEQ